MLVLRRSKKPIENWPFKFLITLGTTFGAGYFNSLGNDAIPLSEKRKILALGLLCILILCAISLPPIS